MMSHPSVETLSSYLDEQLGGPRRQRLEGHLKDCFRCRDRLLGMQRVVRRLEAIERMAPPAHLGHEVRRRASLEAGRTSFVNQLESGARRFTLQSSLLPAFAVVFSLAVIIYMLSWGIHRQGEGRLPVSLEPQAVESPEAVPQAEELGARSDSSLADEPAIGAREIGEEEERSPSSRPLEFDGGSVARVSGRVFVRHDATWIERGLESETPALRLPEDDPVVLAWMESNPELRQLRRLGPAVRLRIDEKVVEIVFAAARSDASPRDQ